MDCFQTARRFAFVGETGSGKTELAVNLAMRLAQTQERQVFFLDMDQTKGLFRGRDLESTLTASGVKPVETLQFQDSPVVPAGVTGLLENPDNICVFDVGGNAIGARMMGQYARQLQTARFFYVINPHRPFSQSGEDICSGMDWICNAGRVDSRQVQIISNPCLGEKTTAKSVLSGHRQLIQNLKTFGRSIELLTVQDTLADAVTDQADCTVIPIRLYVKNLYKT